MRTPLALALALGACAGPAELGSRPPARPLATSQQPARPGAFESVRFAVVPAGTFGPYVSTTATGGVAVWAQPLEQRRVWFGVGFDAEGKPRGEPQRLANAAAEVGLALVRPEAAGHVLLSTKKHAGRTQIESLELDARGRAKASPLTLADVDGDVVWIDLAPTARGTLALWGVKGAGGAELFAALVGQERVVREPFAKAARAWQMAKLGTSAAVAVVGEGGRIDVDVLDDHGAPKARVAVVAGPTSALELDMVSAGRGVVLAWSDRDNVSLAAIDEGAQLTQAPAPLLGVVGEQALVRLVPPHERGKHAYLIWESLFERPAAGRRFLVAPVTADGKLGARRITLEHALADGSVPELAARPNGLSALTLAKVCKTERECASAPVLPTVVELDAELGVTASTPLTISALRGEAPDLAWGLSCASQPCRLLAAQGSSPTPVWSVRAESKPGDWRPAARPLEPPAPPRVAGLLEVAKTAPLADIAVARLGASTLASWLTYFDPSTPWQRLTKPAPDGRLDPVRAELRIRALPESGTPPAAETLSIRARSPGGVALATTSAAPAEALLAWTAIDFKLPQVFVTVVDGKAKKLRQRMLTRAPGDKTDVAAAGLADGWLVAWVDERHGDPEVYAARLGRTLQAAGPEKRLTSAPGVAAEVALLAQGDAALVAWSDARDKDQPGVGDIYVAKLKAQDASLAGSELVIAKTPEHSRSPSLAPLGKGALLAWIEESVSAGGEPGAAAVQVVELGEDGRPSGKPVALAPGDGNPSSVTLDCSAGTCRILVVASRDGSSELRAQDWSSGRAGASKRLAALPSTPGVSPVLVGRELFVAGPAAREGRLRQLLIDWK